MTKYKSSVLTFHDATADCVVCKFLGGDQGREILLEVIRVLDVSLSKSEECKNTLLNSINILSNKLAEKGF